MINIKTETVIDKMVYLFESMKNKLVTRIKWLRTKIVVEFNKNKLTSLAAIALISAIAIITAVLAWQSALLAAIFLTGSMGVAFVGKKILDYLGFFKDMISDKAKVEMEAALTRTESNHTSTTEILKQINTLQPKISQTLTNVEDRLTVMAPELIELATGVKKLATEVKEFANEIKELHDDVEQVGQKISSVRNEIVLLENNGQEARMEAIAKALAMALARSGQFPTPGKPIIPIEAERPMVAVTP